MSTYLGDTALLECKVSGDPSPVIRWQKNREDLPVTFDPNSHLAMLPSGSLQVSRVQPPDSAMYRCLADNPGSSRTGSDAELRVLPGTVGTLIFAVLWEYGGGGWGREWKGVLLTLYCPMLSPVHFLFEVFVIRLEITSVEEVDERRQVFSACFFASATDLSPIFHLSFQITALTHFYMLNMLLKCSFAPSAEAF